MTLITPRTRRRRFKAFTLIELMIVVAIIGILAYALSIKTGDFVRRSREATSKNSLGALRSTLAIYYADNQSAYPVGPVGDDESTLSDALAPIYIKEIPRLMAYPYFPVTQLVDNVGGLNFSALHPTENGRYLYVSDGAADGHGTVSIACYKTDSQGNIWSGY